MNKNKKIIIIAIAAFAAVAIISITIFLIVNSNNKTEEEKYPIAESISFVKDYTYSEMDNVNFYNFQYQFYQSYLEDYNDDNWSIDSPYVVINPFMWSPLTALVMFKTDKEEKVTVTLKGKHGDDLVTVFEASKDHFLPIYGLYGPSKEGDSYDNKVILETESGLKSEITINISTYFPISEAKVISNNITNSNGYFYFTTTSEGTATCAYDNYGELRWYLSYGYTKGMTMLSNGHLLLSNITPGPDVTSTAGVVEIDMFGYVYKDYLIDGGYHHDGLELPNGNLIILTSDTGSDTIADYIVEIDRNTGEVVKDWKLTEIVSKIDQNREYFYPTWGWINGIAYDESKNELVLSVRNENSVVGIDYETGDLKWILGESKYWSDAFEPYLIKGIGDDFIYPHGQHSVNITKDGKLSIFNNNYNANIETTDTPEVSCSSLTDSASYATIYDIDFVNKTAKIDYKFGGKEYFSYALSSYTYSKDGHKLFNSGWEFGESALADPECTQFTASEYESDLIDFDEDNNIQVHLHIYEGKFEALRSQIYHLDEQSVKGTTSDVVANFSISPTDETSVSTTSKSYTLLSDSEVANLKNAKVYPFTFSVGQDLLEVEVADITESEMRVVFLSNDGKGYSFVVQEDGDDGLPRNVNLIELDYGKKYFIYLYYQGEYYNTTYSITLEKGDLT